MTHTWQAGNRMWLGTPNSELPADYWSQMVTLWKSHMINVHSINSPEPTSGQGEMGNNLYFLHACLSPLWWRHWGKIHLPKVSDSTPVFPPSKTPRHQDKVIICVGPSTICLFHIPANTFWKLTFQKKKNPLQYWKDTSIFSMGRMVTIHT